MYTNLCKKIKVAMYSCQVDCPFFLGPPYVVVCKLWGRYSVFVDAVCHAIDSAHALSNSYPQFEGRRVYLLFYILKTVISCLRSDAIKHASLWVNCGWSLCALTHTYSRLLCIDVVKGRTLMRTPTPISPNELHRAANWASHSHTSLLFCVHIATR